MNQLMCVISLSSFGFQGLEELRQIGSALFQSLPYPSHLPDVNFSADSNVLASQQIFFNDSWLSVVLT